MLEKHVVFQRKKRVKILPLLSFFSHAPQVKKSSEQKKETAIHTHNLNIDREHVWLSDEAFVSLGFWEGRAGCLFAHRFWDNWGGGRDLCSFFSCIKRIFFCFRRVRTLYACLAENDGELSFEPNQIITNGKGFSHFF